MSSLDQASTIDLSVVRGHQWRIRSITCSTARPRSRPSEGSQPSAGSSDCRSGSRSERAVSERELELLRCLKSCPTSSPRRQETGLLTRSPGGCAGLRDRFHGFYHDCPVLSEDIGEPLRQARLWLVEGTASALPSASACSGSRLQNPCEPHHRSGRTRRRPDRPEPAF